MNGYSASLVPGVAHGCGAGLYQPGGAAQARDNQGEYVAATGSSAASDGTNAPAIAAAVHRQLGSAVQRVQDEGGPLPVTAARSVP